MNRQLELERAALVALLRRGDKYWWQYAQLVEFNGSALAVLNGDYEEPDRELEELTLFTDPATHAEPDLSAICDEIAGWESDGSQFVTVLDAEYPSNLRSIHNRPPFLFVKGELVPDDQRSVAVVGTRNATAQGLEAAGRIAETAASLGFSVVSGLARGIDTKAHESALSASARTVAVIGTGLRRYYPKENHALQDEIASRCAVVSQFWPDSSPTKRSFPMRNAVMSGFALATVVVEADGRSGARMQARLALEHGRPVFLLRSLLEHAWACEYAERAGTTVVDDFDQIFTRLSALETESLEFV